MSQRTRLAVVATGISFMGTLPLGTLNLSVANLAFHHDVSGALSFAIAAAAVEVLAVRLSLFLINKLQTLKAYYWLFRLLSVAILLTLSVATLVTASKTNQFNVSFPVTVGNPFIAGFTLSVLNPLHLPFWMGWTAVLKNRGILNDNQRMYNWFVISIGIGTLMGFALYGVTGRYLIGLLGRWQSLLNWVLGITLLATALAQLYKAILVQFKIKQQSIV